MNWVFRLISILWISGTLNAQSPIPLPKDAAAFPPTNQCLGQLRVEIPLTNPKEFKDDGDVNVTVSGQLEPAGTARTIPPDRIVSGEYRYELIDRKLITRIMARRDEIADINFRLTLKTTDRDGGSIELGPIEGDLQHSPSPCPDVPTIFFALDTQFNSESLSQSAFLVTVRMRAEASGKVLIETRTSDSQVLHIEEQTLQPSKWTTHVLIGLPNAKVLLREKSTGLVLKTYDAPAPVGYLTVPVGPRDLSIPLGFIALTGLTALAFMAHGRRKDHKRIVDFEWWMKHKGATVDGLDQVKSSVNTRNFQVNKNRSGNPDEDDAIEENKKLPDLNARIHVIENAVNKWQPASLVSELTQVLRMVETSPSDKLCAAVNEWWKKGPNQRKDLWNLCKEISLEMSFYTLVESHSGKSPGFNFVKDQQNGGWIGARVDEKRELLLLPRYPKFLALVSSELAPFFDGLEPSNESIVFRMAFRACVLHELSSKPEYFNVEDKGYLQLEGSAAPDLREPPSYDKILGQLKQQEDIGSDETPESKLRALDTALRMLKDALCAIRELEGFRDEEYRFKGNTAQVLGEITGRLDEAERTIKPVRSEIERMQQDLEQLKNHPALLVRPTVSLGSSLGQKPKDESAETQALNPSPPVPSHDLGLPDKWWKETMGRMRIQDVPSNGLEDYFSRTRRLKDELTRFLRGFHVDVKLLYLRTEKMGSLVGSEAEEREDGSVVANNSSLAQRELWSVFVAVGKSDCTQVFILFPPGLVGYTGVMSLLFEETALDKSFVDDVVRPAELQRKHEGSGGLAGVYGVKMKMQLSWKSV